MIIIFSSIDNEYKAHFSGFLMAYGVVPRGSYTQEYIRVGIHVSQKDIDIVLKFKDCIKSTYKILWINDSMIVH